MHIIDEKKIFADVSAKTEAGQIQFVTLNIKLKKDDELRRFIEALRSI